MLCYDAGLQLPRLLLAAGDESLVRAVDRLDRVLALCHGACHKCSVDFTNALHAGDCGVTT